MPTRASSGRPPWVWIVAGLIAIAVAVVAFNALFGGEEGGDAGTTPSGGAVTVEEATATMCGHVRQTQVFRVQALAQAEDVLKADAKTLKQAGDPQAAKQVRSLITATEDLRQALADQQDTSEVLAAQADAIAALPCG